MTAFIAVIVVLPACFGLFMLALSLPRMAAASHPFVNGVIVARRPIFEWGIPRADFSIKIENTSTVVHARTQRYLLMQVSDQVRFHYSGDPSLQVFLTEQEENPLWIGLFCLGGSAFLGLKARELLKAGGQ